MGAQSARCRDGHVIEPPVTLAVRPRASSPACRDMPDLPYVAECLPPVFLEIAGYLVGTPSDAARLLHCSSSVDAQLQLGTDSLWSGLYRRRWPAFHDCLEYQGVKDWRGFYRETFFGWCECTLEVFDREKKLGFAMAAMAARVQYQARLDCYVARYLSASEIIPEMIPSKEERRLRFCPPSARSRLRPGLLPGGELSPDARMDAEIEMVKAAVGSTVYPYRVLEGVDGLEVGQGVELQWKMQYGSPFGWWFGQLESLHLDADGKRARATITFNHFPSSSRWYRLEVRFGDSEMRPCGFGGYTGGLRAASEAERKHWMLFFPKDPVVF
mmetsp:Transcript_100091/g.283493  ORF Transcript_100091/g.283493 Transcript_100091/m.283493 type:complete len:328 (+) Transcript_100091:69-1052(+)